MPDIGGASLADLEAMYQANKKATAKPQPKAGGVKGAVINLLPLVGGAVGGIGGSFLAPGLGTAAGGAAGSGLGEFLREKLQGEDINKGSIGREALLGALPGALEGVSGGIKAARAGESFLGGMVGKGATKAVEGEVAQTVAKKSLADKVAAKGTQIEARSGGYGVGEKLAGQDALGFYDSAKINKNLVEEGIKAGNPNARLQQVEDVLNVKNGALKKMISANSTDISIAERRALADRYLQSVEALPGVDDAVRKQALNLAQNLERQGVTDEALLNIKRGVDKDVLSYIANPDAATSAKQMAGSAYRNLIRDELNTRIPGIQTLNNSTHNLYDARGFLKGGAKALSDQSQSAGGGVLGRILSSETAQGVKSKVGSGLTKVAGVAGGAVEPATATATASTPSFMRQLLGGSFKQGVARGVGEPFFAPTEDPNALPAGDMGAQPAATPDSTFTADLASFDPAASDSASTDPFSGDMIKQAILKDMQATGGKNTSTLLSLYNAFGKTATTSDPAAVKQSRQKSKAALTNVKAIEQLYNEAGGAQSRVPGFVSSLLGKAGIGDTQKVESYNAIKEGLISTIARGMGEVGTLTDQDVARISKMLPNINDRKEEAARKLRIIKSILQENATASGSGADTTSLQSLGA